MRQFWQRVVGFVGDDPEVAGVSVLVVFVAFAASVVFVAQCIVTGRYATGAGVGTGVVGVLAVCIRDFRRDRWSFVSRVALAVWLLLSGLAIVYACWAAWPFHTGSAGALFGEAISYNCCAAFKL